LKNVLSWCKYKPSAQPLSYIWLVSSMTTNCYFACTFCNLTLNLLNTFLWIHFPFIFSNTTIYKIKLTFCKSGISLHQWKIVTFECHQLIVWPLLQHLQIHGYGMNKVYDLAVNYSNNCFCINFPSVESTVFQLAFSKC